MTDDQKGSKFGLGMILGLLLGGITGVLFTPKSGKETREELAAKLSELKEKIDDAEIDKRVKEMYGRVTEEGKKAYKDARREITKRLDQLSEIDFEKYKKMVWEVVESIKEGKLSRDDLAKLKNSLVEDWNRVGEKAKKPKS